MNEYAIYAFTILFGIIGYLLSRKDAQQEQEILSQKQAREVDLKVTQALSLQLASGLETILHSQKEVQKLFELHDADAASLADLRLHIAAEHYHKKELDTRFEKLDLTFREGFKDLGDRFDKLTTALLDRSNNAR